jgi:hypothetical protein
MVEGLREILNTKDITELRNGHHCPYLLTKGLYLILLLR